MLRWHNESPGSKQALIHYLIQWWPNSMMSSSITRTQWVNSQGNGAYHVVNTLRLRQDESHFADDIFKCIFLNENLWFTINISLKFVPKHLFNNISALVQIMAWRRWGDKSLSVPMMVSLLMHICVTQPQWVKPWMPNLDLFFKRAIYHCSWNLNFL